MATEIGVLFCVFSLTVTLLADRSEAYECNFVSTILLDPEVGDTGFITSANFPNSYPNINSYCKVDFHVCVGCSIKVTFEDATLLPCQQESAPRSEKSLVCDPSIQCEYFIWNQEGGETKILMGNLTLQEQVSTLSSSLHLQFCYSSHARSPENLRKTWKLQFTVIDLYSFRVSGTASTKLDGFSVRNQGVIRSPGFPDAYTHNETIHSYLLQGYNVNDCIHIVFDDFDINPYYSFLEIHDGPVRLKHSPVYKNNSVRPIFTSSSQYLLLVFFAGFSTKEQLHRGFKATCHFLSEEDAENIPVVVQDCAPVKVWGGTVSQTGRKWSNSHHQQVYDCAWSLPTPSIPSNSTVAMMLHLLVFKLTAETEEHHMEIRDKPHSDSFILGSISQPFVPNMLPPLGYTSAEGLYVRLRTPLAIGDMVLFSYSPYIEITSENNETVCNNTEDREWFRCERTSRCIPIQLVCDGYNHCGDNSDETEPACEDTVSVQSRSECSPRHVLCGDGTCVRHVAFCQEHPAKSCIGKWHRKCQTTKRCYSDEERCDGISQCSDSSDEDSCGSMHGVSFSHSLGGTWYFLLPAVMLVIALSTGCVIYKICKTKREYQAACTTDAIQLSQFSGNTGTSRPVHVSVPPPSYEECLTTAATNTTTFSQLNPEEETELPPSYEEAKLLVPPYWKFSSTEAPSGLSACAGRRSADVQHAAEAGDLPPESEHI